MKATKRIPQRENWGSAKLHREKVAKKDARIAGLEDLLATYEANPDSDHDYVLHLRSQLRNARNQREAYKPVFE